MSNNELRHFKYVDKYKKNGEWIYVYPGEKAKKNVLGQTTKYGKKVGNNHTGNLEYHKWENKQATNQVAKNTPSRNVPGANDQTSTSGKQMSKLQQDKAKYMAKVNQQNIKNNGPKSNWGKNNFNEVATKDWHKSQLESSAPKTSKTESVQTTKKQIKQGIRKAKIKTLKREASKAIKRAQDWLKDLFD